VGAGLPAYELKIATFFVFVLAGVLRALVSEHPCYQLHTAF
jgi:hypothetical protein